MKTTKEMNQIIESIVALKMAALKVSKIIKTVEENIEIINPSKED